MPKALEEAIRSRRTLKDFDGSEIPKSLIERGLELAILAPNHRLNQPWRFRVYSKRAIETFREALKSECSEEERKTYEAPLLRLSKVGALIVVSCLTDEHPTVDLENYAATSAAIQNLLLFMAAEGVGSYWSTAKLFTNSIALKHFGLTNKERLVGAIWLGRGVSPEPKPRKPLAEVTEWL